MGTSLLSTTNAFIPFPPNQVKFSSSHGPSPPVNLTTIDGHSDTLNSLIYTCKKTKAKNQIFHWDGTNPKENDEVAPIFSSSLKDFFPKVYFQNVLLLNKYCNFFEIKYDLIYLF
jgi:hypothetical protein